MKIAVSHETDFPQMAQEIKQQTSNVQQSYDSLVATAKRIKVLISVIRRPILFGRNSQLIFFFCVIEPLRRILKEVSGIRRFLRCY